MSIMDRKEQTTRALISALYSSNRQHYVPTNKDLIKSLSAPDIQPPVTTLVVPPPPYGVAITSGVTNNPPSQATIATLARDFPATNIKL